MANVDFSMVKKEIEKDEPEKLEDGIYKIGESYKVINNGRFVVEFNKDEDIEYVRNYYVHSCMFDDPIYINLIEYLELKYKDKFDKMYSNAIHITIEP